MAAHIVIEHSSNLRRQLNLPRFVEAIRQAALATGIFPRAGMKTRSFESEPYCHAHCHRDNTFVHLCVRVGQRPDQAACRQACEEIFAAACEQLRAVRSAEPPGISVEMQELGPDVALPDTNIHDYERKGPRHP